MELRLLRVTRSVRLSSEVAFGNNKFFCKTRVVSLSFFMFCEQCLAENVCFLKGKHSAETVVMIAGCCMEN